MYSSRREIGRFETGLGDLSLRFLRFVVGAAVVGDGSHESAIRRKLTGDGSRGCDGGDLCPTESTEREEKLRTEGTRVRGKE